MSIKNECEIVRDLLPLYAEKMVCCETAEFVRDHLEGCASCRAELEQIGSGQSDKKEKNDEIPAENGTAPLARIGKIVFKRKMYAVLMTALILSAFLVSVFGYLSSPEYLPYSPDTVSVGETADGALAAAASAARHFLGENDAVAAFLGMPDRADSEQTDTADLPNAAQDDARVQAEADAYILRYNRIYANLR